MDGSVDEWITRWMDDEWMMDRWMVGGNIGGWITRWMDDGWMNYAPWSVHVGQKRISGLESG